MDYKLILLVAIVGIAAGQFCGSPCPPGSDSSKCDCCPEPCCCRCTNSVQPAPTMEPKSCRNLLDLALVIDSSGSIGSRDWAAAKLFIKNILSILNSVGDAQHVALINYSTNATLAWNLDSAETSSADALNDAVDQLEPIGQFTNTVEALEVTVDSVFNGLGGDSPDRANFLLLVTDGRSNFRLEDRADVAARAHAVATVATIGITTQTDDAELELFASSPRDALKVNNFNDLVDKLLNEVANKVCPTKRPPKEECFCCCPPPPTRYPYGY